MNIGIVGHEEAKFNSVTEEAAKKLIRSVVSGAACVVSGGCHLGGVDIWAEKTADMLSIPKKIHLPKNRRWDTGYKERNLLIAKDSDVVHVILVKEYPEGYDGMRFPLCYHCKSTEHIKSGGCWTGLAALTLGKRAVWHTIAPDGTVVTEDRSQRYEASEKG